MRVQFIQLVQPANTMKTEIIEPALRELILAAAVSSAALIGGQGGFRVAIRCGQVERTLAATRGGVRMFASLDTANAFLRKLGISKFEVDTQSYQRQLLRKPRPDRAEALRKTRTRPQQQSLL